MEKTLSEINHRVRKTDPQVEATLIERGMHPLLARLLAARGVEPDQPQRMGLVDLLNPNLLKGNQDAANTLADALEAGARIVIVGDYDCDGATATAVAMRGFSMLLESMGICREDINEQIQFLVPNRFKTGYGLNPEIVRQAVEEFEPDLLVTVDNGIASVDGVQAANELGVGVIVTDHHLPGDELPQAVAIVNPNQPGCTFPSKAMAGVGVMFYVLLATRAVLRERGAFEGQAQPRLDRLLDLVALGTVADVVQLDVNNRRLVDHGLRRVRAGQTQPGVLALFHEAGKDHRQAVASDMGFLLGPRLNAAGRLSDMSVGINCLISDDAHEAAECARVLAGMNTERKRIEASMKQEALSEIDWKGFEDNPSAGVVLANETWHQGVIGILASRVKDRLYRPTVVLAKGDDGSWKGSGRSIPGVHLRDVLDLVSKRMPKGAMPKFGGHAAAAGLTLQADALAQFKTEFDQAVRTFIDECTLTQTIESDGSLPVDCMLANIVGVFEEQVWGQGFPAPLFFDEFEVLNQRLLKDAHSKFTVRREGKTFSALRWGSVAPLPAQVQLVYRLEKDRYTGGQAVQLVIEHVL